MRIEDVSFLHRPANAVVALRHVKDTFSICLRWLEARCAFYFPAQRPLPPALHNAGDIK